MNVDVKCYVSLNILVLLLLSLLLYFNININMNITVIITITITIIYYYYYSPNGMFTLAILLLCYCVDVVPEDEESLLNRRLFQRYGIRKSAIQRSSVFTSPIGGDYYELYSPLTGEDHAVIQRAFTGKEELGEGWCTRWVGRDPDCVHSVVFADYR